MKEVSETMEPAPDTGAQSNADIQGLISNGPAVGYEDKLVLFGQFIGDWEADFTVYSPEGDVQTEKAEWHWGWVLEGRAVQDVFIIPRRSERDKVSAVRSDYGTAIRFYDPGIDAWRVTYISPPNGEVHTLIARDIGGEIVLEGSDADGSLMRWIFSNITPVSFHWRRVFSSDGGHTWQLHKEMSVRRVSTTRLPSVNS